MRAILLISHGSRSREARREVERLARDLQRRCRLRIVEFAFLEVERPTIPEGIQACVRKGASEIVALLNFLNSGNHVLLDVPAILRAEKKRFPTVAIRMTRAIGAHPRIPHLFIDLYRKTARKQK